jgi:hypothetical protein
VVVDVRCAYVPVPRRAVVIIRPQSNWRA